MVTRISSQAGISPPFMKHSRSSPFVLFRNRNYSVLWLTEFFSEFAVALSNLATTIIVFRLTGSAFQVGLVLVVQSLPSLLIGLIAGVFADRYDHRRTMWITRMMRAGVLLVLPLLLPVGLFNAILLPFAQRAMGATDLEYSLFESIQSVGFVAGALLMVALADRLHEGQWLTISFSGLGATMLWLIIAPNVATAYLPLFALGLVNAPNYVVRGLLVQHNSPRHLRGRVASTFSLMRHAMLCSSACCWVVLPIKSMCACSCRCRRLASSSPACLC